jgi:hypothetical protein
VGTICRRQHTHDVERIMRELAANRLRLHGFGVKTTGLARYADTLSSSDSMSWSFRGRHVPGCTPSHRTESNCVHFALNWYRQVRHALIQRTPHPDLGLPQQQIAEPRMWSGNQARDRSPGRCAV